MGNLIHIQTPLGGAVTVGYNRGRNELAREILQQIGLASTVDADKLRELLASEVEPEGERRNGYELDGRLRAPDYVYERATCAFRDPQNYPNHDAPKRKIS